MNVLGFAKALLARQDRVYSLSLLVPFIIYNLALKTLEITSLLGEHELAQALSLMGQAVLFNLGYALLWLGLFAAVHTSKGPRRQTVVFLFRTTTILVVLVTTFAYLYYRETGTTLEYSTRWIAELDEIKLTFQEAPPLVWMLLAATLFYVVLGPLLLAHTVEWRRGRPGTFSPVEAHRTYLYVSLGLLLLTLSFGSQSVLTSATALARDSFASFVLIEVEGAAHETGVGEVTTGEEAAAETEVAAVTTEEDNSNAALATEHPAAYARLVQTFQAQKRNVVLIHLESTRARSVTPYNEELKTTPFLEELARNSLLVERAYVGSIPRSSMTNISVNCGIQPPPRPGPDELGSTPVPCLADLLRDQGYSAAFFSSNVDEYGDLATTNWGYEKVFAPPVPGVPTQYWDAAMDPESFARTSHYGYEEDIMLEPSENWLKGHKDEPFLAEYLTSTGHDEYRCLDTRHGSEDFSEDDLINHYLNCLRLQDIFLKNLFDQYKELGLYDNTIFVLFGDHGEGFGEHGRFMHGDTIWEEGLRVPLIIHAPGWFEDGERAEGLSNYTDILPTVVEMLGYEVENGEYPGYSLLHPLPADRTLFFSCISNRKCLASIKGEEKYIYHYGNQPDEVFDLSEDPLEKQNLAERYSEGELDKRRKELFAWLSRIDTQYGHGTLSWSDQLRESTGRQAGQSGGLLAEPTVAVGQPLVVGDLEWTVTNSELADQLVSSVDGGVKRGNFIIVDFQLKNNSDEGLDLSSRSLALFDGDGRRFKFDTDTYLYIDRPKNMFRFEVGPGASEEGQVIFEVPPDASQFQLQLGERNPFSNRSGYVNLGF